VEIDGRPSQMLHGPDWAPRRPLATPLWAAPMGPKGFATAREAGVDGVIFPDPPAGGVSEFKASALLVNGTVRRPGEDHTSPRLVEAAGPWFAAGFHAVWELYPTALDGLPGGAAWREATQAARPAAEAHLAVHEGHAVALTERDRTGIAAAGEAVAGAGWTGDAASIRARVRDLATSGLTELVYTPAGPDLPGEIEAFATAATGS
jgi:5,10-methylenetetrahydromethanopterin reductase